MKYFGWFQIPILEIEMIIDTSHLLVGVNSAANFFLYYLLRKNFRSATWRLLTCKKLPPPAGPGMTRQMGNNNCSTTSFINRNTESTRVQRRATVAVARFESRLKKGAKHVCFSFYWLAANNN